MDTVFTVQPIFESFIKSGIIEVSTNITHLGEQVFPVGLVKFHRRSFFGGKGSNGLIQTSSERFVAQFLTVHPDQRELIRKQPSADKVVQRRNEQSTHQITARAKDYQIAGRGFVSMDKSFGSIR